MYVIYSQRLILSHFATYVFIIPAQLGIGIKINADPENLVYPNTK